MGDRGNIVVNMDRPHDNEEVYLYTHWGGSELKKMLASALARGRSRWDDPGYLARIIFCDMILGLGEDGIHSVTGLGITTYLTDNDHPILRVDCELRLVEQEDAEQLAIEESWTFDDFVNLFYKEEEN